MSRTDIPPATLARSLRRMAGDGSIEWVREPIQASVLLDVADMLDENAKLRKLAADMYEGLNCPTESYEGCPPCPFNSDNGCAFELRMHELGVEVQQ